MTQQGIQSNTFFKLSKNVKIDQNKGLLLVAKEFAEKHLSDSARKYSSNKDDQFYYWTWGKQSAVVIFEVPRVFHLSFNEVMRYMYTYCQEYIIENNLRESVIYHRYMDNFNRDLR